MDLTWLSNITQHPKTTFVGMLVAATAIGGVLIQNGVTLGNVGTSNRVTLVIGIASALLGMMAKDPDAPTQSK